MLFFSGEKIFWIDFEAAEVGQSMYETLFFIRAVKKHGKSLINIAWAESSIWSNLTCLDGSTFLQLI